MYFGVCVTILITFFWVGTTHCFKFLFLPTTKFHHSLSSTLRGNGATHQQAITSVWKTWALPSISITTQDSMFSDNGTTKSSKVKPGMAADHDPHQFKAPFFARWDNFMSHVEWFLKLFFPAGSARTLWFSSFRFISYFAGWRRGVAPTPKLSVTFCKASVIAALPSAASSTDA